MYIEVRFPDIELDYTPFGNFWLKFTMGGGVSDDYQVATLAGLYFRLVESAARSYEAGVACTRDYWNTNSHVALGSIQQATTHFEVCISNMHRAVTAFTRLRKHKNLGQLNVIQSRKPRFVSAQIHDQLRNARNEIHHMENCVMDGTVVMGQSSAIRADGLELPHPTEPGQTNKTIDRVTVGNHTILATDLADWLTEMILYCKMMGADGGPKPLVA